MDMSARAGHQSAIFLCVGSLPNTHALRVTLYTSSQTRCTAAFARSVDRDGRYPFDELEKLGLRCSRVTE